MIEGMAVQHMTEAELVRDIASVMDRVQSGEEIIIERNARPLAVLRAAAPKRRKLSEIVAALPERSAANTGRRTSQPRCSRLSIATGSRSIPRSALQPKGIRVALGDLLIGATALELGYSVLTSNIRHFEKIPGLIVIPQ
jgi:predicted nucleic acid-binding protein